MPLPPLHWLTSRPADPVRPLQVRPCGLSPLSLPLSHRFLAVRPLQVVVATNAAESSITLPDCDCVICLGTHKVPP